MNNTKRAEKTMKVLPVNYCYLSSLKNALRENTGINISFNDVIAMIQHSFSVEQMVEQLTTKAVEKTITNK
ncbi:hypothetical protein [Pontibacter virosus]|uniref:Uncharacterized protein n=1 Tax=Pontibacter virosus TaxID=1765052 RepID=A0A2U1B2E7_9BACT|nr:hypothetical protein [Pontibacter virosus]PVY42833.1 hypothetical protein C8E01_1026 [Pontibacter virosus]